MPAVHLIPNTKLTIGEEPAVIRGLPEGDIYFLEMIKTGEIKRYRHCDIAKMIPEGLLKVCTVKSKTLIREQTLSEKLEKDFNSLTESEKENVKRRLSYVQEYLNSGSTKRTEFGLMPLIDKISNEIKDEKPPHWTTLNRWIRDFLESHKDHRSLSRNIHKRGNRKPYYPSEVSEIMTEAIEKRYLTQQRLRPMDAWNYAVKKIYNLNEMRDKSEHLPTPSKNMMYRAINQLEPYICTARRYGQNEADKKYMCVQEGPKSTRPLQRVEIDHTILDLIIVDEQTGIPIGRPTLTVAIDHYSRMPVGLYIGYEPPGWTAVMHCLRQMILPKEEFTNSFSSLKNSWDCYGIPETLVVDNGREFHSEALETACATLGTEIQYSPRAKPWYKGSIERFFGTANSSFFHKIGGTTFSNIADKGNYKSESEAVLAMREISEFFTKWIVDVYARDFHRGIKDLPGDRWKNGVINFPVRLPSNLSDISITISAVMQRTIQRDGIEIQYLKYQSEELSGLRRRIPGKQKNPKVEIKLDPSDLSKIHVLDPESGEYIQVSAVDQDYTRNMNLFAHREIIKIANKEMAGKLDICGLAKARDGILELTNSANVTNKRKQKPKKKAARRKGIGSNQISKTGMKSVDSHEGYPRQAKISSDSPTRETIELELEETNEEFEPYQIDEEEWSSDFGLPT